MYFDHENWSWYFYNYGESWLGTNYVTLVSEGMVKHSPGKFVQVCTDFPTTIL